MDEPINGEVTAPLPQPAPGIDPNAAYPPPTDPNAAYPPPTAASDVPPTPSAPPVVPPHPPQARGSLPVPLWVVVSAAVIGALVILAITFGLGVAVGAHSTRYDRVPAGMGMVPPGLDGGEQGWQDGGSVPGPRGGDPRGGGMRRWNDDARDDYQGYGGRGRGFHRALPSPDATTQP